MQSNKSRDRFNQIAEQFLHSEVHQMSPSIQRVLQMNLSWKAKRICDVACGAGHFGISFHDQATDIVAVDPSENMLKTAQNLAKEKGITSYQTVQAFAENIPLPDDSFDLVISRLAPHHFVDIQQAVNEMARIAKPDGHVVVIDLAGYEDLAIDAFNHQIEVLHDPTHQRSYTASEWQEFFSQAGLIINELHDWQMERPQGLSIKQWCQIASSGSDAENHIRQLLKDAPSHYLETMRIEKREDDYYLPIKTIVIVGQKRRDTFANHQNL